MATHNEVLSYLRPNGGYISYGGTYEGIFFEPQCDPFTKEEYEAAANELVAAKAKAEAEKASARTAAEAKLTALGLTSDDLRALGL